MNLQTTNTTLWLLFYYLYVKVRLGKTGFPMLHVSKSLVNVAQYYSIVVEEIIKLL